jgi:hypothetical protein
MFMPMPFYTSTASGNVGGCSMNLIEPLISRADVVGRMSFIFCCLVAAMPCCRSIVVG